MGGCDELWCVEFELFSAEFSKLFCGNQLNFLQITVARDESALEVAPPDRRLDRRPTAFTTMRYRQPLPLPFTIVIGQLHSHTSNVTKDITFCRIASRMRSFSSSACLNSSFLFSFSSNFFCDSCSLNFTLCAVTCTHLKTS